MRMTLRGRWESQRYRWQRFWNIWNSLEPPEVEPRDSWEGRFVILPPNVGVRGVARIMERKDTPGGTWYAVQPYDPTKPQREWTAFNQFRIALAIHEIANLFLYDSYDSAWCVLRDVLQREENQRLAAKGIQ